MLVNDNLRAFMLVMTACSSAIITMFNKNKINSVTTRTSGSYGNNNQQELICIFRANVNFRGNSRHTGRRSAVEFWFGSIFAHKCAEIGSPWRIFFEEIVCSIQLIFD